MSLKLLVLAILLISVSTEAKNFLKKLHNHDLTSALRQPLHLSTLNLVRTKRDAGEEVFTEDDALDLAKYFVTAGWEQDKTEMVAELVTGMGDRSTNITVVGWQRILDDDGNVKEIKTVQIVLPPKPEEDLLSIVEEDDDDDFEEDDERVLPHKTIKKMRAMLDPMAKVGTPGSVVYESFDENNKHTNVLYVDKDELFVFNEGFSIYNKTSAASRREVDKFLSHLTPTNLGKPTVLRFDVDGKLIEKESHIEPYLLGIVQDNTDATDTMLREGPQLVAEITQKYSKKEVPKILAEHYNKQYPTYSWRVLNNPSNYYVTRDIDITLSFDNFDLYENSYVNYVLYGLKK